MRLYNTTRWQKLRDAQLREHPLCLFCQQHGAVAQADTVDHIIPHKGNHALFFDKANLQSLCKPCHDSHKKQIELRGYAIGCDNNGWPTDRNHPINNK